MAMHISSQGIALIQNYEGLRTTAYKPLKNESGWTIGYGHHGPDVKSGMVCTEQWAYEQLLRDLRPVEHQLISALNADEIEVTQGQFDALCSLGFNLSGGIRKLVKFKLWTKLKAGDVKGAASDFLHINKAGGREVRGLTLRRRAEASLFLS